MSVAIVGASIAAVSSGYGIYKGIKQDKLANKVVVPDVNFQPSTALPLAQQMFNGRMPGAATAEQNIMGNQANAIGATDRNASSGAQALALIGAIQGQSNKAFTDLNQQEGAFKLNAFSNLAGIEGNELDRQYGDEVRARQEAIGEKTALRGSGMTNVANGINGLGNAAYLFSMMNNGGGDRTTTPNRVRMANPQLAPPVGAPRATINPNRTPYIGG